MARTRSKRWSSPPENGGGTVSAPSSIHLGCSWWNSATEASGLDFPWAIRIGREQSRKPI